MLYERISAVELKQLEFQKKTEEKFDKVFGITLQLINAKAVDHMRSAAFFFCPKPESARRCFC